MPKVNPRRKPASYADVDRAWKEGCIEGMRLAEAMDKGYFTAADLRRTLKEEYGIELLAGPSKAIAHGRTE